MRDRRGKTKKPLYGVGINDSIYLTETRIEGKRIKCPYYVIWSTMLKRAYSYKFHISRPTYRSVIVCDDWLLFSNFKSWMEKQDWQGKQLDKDMLFPNNKVYSPETCIFIPNYLNNLLGYKGEHPGVFYRKDRAKYMVRIYHNGTTKHLGYFSTLKEADRCYAINKINILKGIIFKITELRLIKGIYRHIKKLEEVL